MAIAATDVTPSVGPEPEESVLAPATKQATMPAAPATRPTQQSHDANSRDRSMARAQARTETPTGPHRNRFNQYAAPSSATTRSREAPSLASRAVAATMPYAATSRTTLIAMAPRARSSSGSSSRRWRSDAFTPATNSTRPTRTMANHAAATAAAPAWCEYSLTIFDAAVPGPNGPGGAAPMIATHSSRYRTAPVRAHGFPIRPVGCWVVTSVSSITKPPK